MHKTILTLIIVAVALLGGGYWYTQQTQTPTGTQNGTGMQNRYGAPDTNISTTTGMGMMSATEMQNNMGQAMMHEYTIAQVATHDSASDCYMAIDNNVYDLTDYIARSTHKAGMAVVSAECGKDATTIFNMVHTGRKATKAYDQLAGYYIGTLVQ